MTTPEMLDRAAAAVRERLSGRPRVHVVLGSGLGSLAEELDDAVAIPFEEIPGFPGATVPGHTGRFHFGRMEGVPVLLQAGRLHLYEGHAAEVVAGPVRLGRALGSEILILTNAAGGIARGLEPGSLVLIRDHLNLQFRSPLAGPVWPGEQRFPDMTRAWDPELRAVAMRVAREQSVELKEGVYAGVPGPAFETPAEIRFLAGAGADVVGMSTVPEVLVARAGGIRCLGFSMVTNLAAGLSESPLSHQEVMETGDRAAPVLGRLIRGVVAVLGTAA